MIVVVASSSRIDKSDKLGEYSLRKINQIFNFLGGINLK